jgi:alanine racemase
MYSTWAEINLDNLAHNFRGIKQKIGPGVKTLVAVKANAYGHGAVPVSQRLLAEGADMLGVATVSEVAELRHAGIQAPILLLGCTLPEAVGPALDLDARLTVCDLECAQHVAAAARARKKRALVHVKVDTGMGRIGVPWPDAQHLARQLAAMDGISIEGISTHFASADEADKSFTHRQISLFKEIITSLETAGVRIPLKHAANSSALMDLPESYLTMVRPGLILYGLHPGEGVSHSIPIEPVLSLKTRIAFIKEIEPGQTVSYGRTFTAKRRSRVATLPIGYADGLSRDLSNRGQVLVAGRRVPIIGRICMDQTVIDVTDVPPPRLGDEVVVYGSQGDERISVEEVARLLDTIPYVITCAVGPRVPRVMVGNQKVTCY